jgi:transcriptional regulator with XRE-family HTH domain
MPSRLLKFDESRFAKDFVVGDRRLEERADIKPSIIAAPETRVEWVPGWTQSPGRGYVGGYEFGGFMYRVEVSEEMEGRDTRPLNLLVDLMRYGHTSAADRSYSFLQRIGSELKRIRESQRLTQSQIAEEAGVGRFTFSRWEAGGQSPSAGRLYLWCKALGLVLPPRTALVRVCDNSPELLRFLREDPARLHALSPEKFEQFVAERLDRAGFNVKLTGLTNRKDGGIDLIAVPKAASVGSIVIAAQMKHHQVAQKTGRDAVDRLLAWKDSMFGVGLLVTNTSFTKDAIWTAQQERNSRFLKLRDFTDLKRWLEDQFSDDAEWREIPARIELAPGCVIEVPRPGASTETVSMKDAASVRSGENRWLWD